MSSNYIDIHEKIDGIKKKLSSFAQGLEEIKPEERGKYENPQYRMWSGNIRELDRFTTGLEEWLDQPSAAEAKRHLLDLKKWSEPQEISLEEIEKDWRFLSDNVGEIKNIHKQIGDVRYESIKKFISGWILQRIIEKDMEKAKNWATNANKFANSLKQLEDKKVESKLAGKIKKDSIEELSKETSFDKDNNEKIRWHQELIDRAESIVKNKPTEIEENAILKTYSAKKDIEYVFSKIKEIKNHLINLEWVKKFTDFKDYNKVWEKKQVAMDRDDLESISGALSGAIETADRWKESKKKEIYGALLRCERMVRNTKKDEFTSLKEKARDINWDKPDLASLYKIETGISDLRNRLKKELIEKLQNEDAISIIEEPKIIEDLGQEKGWDFDRFFKALEIVLRSGIIGIKMGEEK